MDVSVKLGINEGRHETEKEKVERSKGGKEGGRSGVATGEKVDHAVDIRGIADIAKFHFEVEEIRHAIHFHGKSRTIRKVIDQGVDFA